MFSEERVVEVFGNYFVLSRNIYIHSKVKQYGLLCEEE